MYRLVSRHEGAGFEPPFFQLLHSGQDAVHRAHEETLEIQVLRKGRTGGTGRRQIRQQYQYHSRAVRGVNGHSRKTT